MYRVLLGGSGRGCRNNRDTMLGRNPTLPHMNKPNHVQVRLQPNPLLWGAIRAGNKHLLGSLTKTTLAAYKTWPERK